MDAPLELATEPGLEGSRVRWAKGGEYFKGWRAVGAGVLPHEAHAFDVERSSAWSLFFERTHPRVKDAELVAELLGKAIGASSPRSRVEYDPTLDGAAGDVDLNAHMGRRGGDGLHFLELAGGWL